MTEISIAMLIWLEMGCNGCHTKRKYGYQCSPQDFFKG